MLSIGSLFASRSLLDPSLRRLSSWLLHCPAAAYVPLTFPSSSDPAKTNLTLLLPPFSAKIDQPLLLPLVASLFVNSVSYTLLRCSRCIFYSFHGHFHRLVIVEAVGPPLRFVSYSLPPHTPPSPLLAIRLSAPWLLPHAILLGS